MKQISVAIIGTGWCGGIRAETCAAYPLVKSLHLAEVRAERLEEITRQTRAATSVADYRKLLEKKDIEAVFISATPKDIVDRLHAAFVQTMKAPEVIARLATGGVEAVTSASPAEFAAYVAAETLHWGRAAKEAGATAD